MKLVVDTRNGLAGDIMAAGLIGLGADPSMVVGAMERAGNLIGRAKASHLTADGIHRISLFLDEKPSHIHAGDAREFLDAAFRECGIKNSWSGMGASVLEALIAAETHVHSSHPALKGHFHGEPVLHEASDIIIDIAGMAAGFMELDIRAVEYLDHVNVGGGTVTFSHGTLEVPTPATRHILDTSGIPWRKSEAGMEMATPTGAAMLAGTGAVRTLKSPGSSRKALAGGTRPLPPILFMLAQE